MYACSRKFCVLTSVLPFNRYYDGDQEKLFNEAHVVSPHRKEYVKKVYASLRYISIAAICKGKLNYKKQKLKLYSIYIVFFRVLVQTFRCALQYIMQLRPIA